MKSSDLNSSTTIGERARSAERALNLFDAVRRNRPHDEGSSACIVISSEVGYDLVLESEEGALGRVSRLLRAGGTPAALLHCSAKGEISARVLDESGALDDLMMARVRETFEAMHYARLLYPTLPPADSHR